MTFYKRKPINSDIHNLRVLSFGASEKNINLRENTTETTSTSVKIRQNGPRSRQNGKGLKTFVTTSKSEFFQKIKDKVTNKCLRKKSSSFDDLKRIPSFRRKLCEEFLKQTLDYIDGYKKPVRKSGKDIQEVEVLYKRSDKPLYPPRNALIKNKPKILRFEQKNPNNYCNGNVFGKQVIPLHTGRKLYHCNEERVSLLPKTFANHQLKYPAPQLSHTNVTRRREKHFAREERSTPGICLCDNGERRQSRLIIKTLFKHPAKRTGVKGDHTAKKVFRYNIGNVHRRPAKTNAEDKEKTASKVCSQVFDANEDFFYHEGCTDNNHVDVEELSNSTLFNNRFRDIYRKKSSDIVQKTFSSNKIDVRSKSNDNIQCCGNQELKDLNVPVNYTKGRKGSTKKHKVTIYKQQVVQTEHKAPTWACVSNPEHPKAIQTDVVIPECKCYYSKAQKRFHRTIFLIQWSPCLLVAFIFWVISYPCSPVYKEKGSGICASFKSVVVNRFHCLISNAYRSRSIEDKNFTCKCGCCPQPKEENVSSMPQPKKIVPRCQCSQLPSGKEQNFFTCCKCSNQSNDIVYEELHQRSSQESIREFNCSHMKQDAKCDTQRNKWNQQKYMLEYQHLQIDEENETDTITTSKYDETCIAGLKKEKCKCLHQNNNIVCEHPPRSLSQQTDLEFNHSPIKLDAGCDSQTHELNKRKDMLQYHRPQNDKKEIFFSSQTKSSHETCHTGLEKEKEFCNDTRRKSLRSLSKQELSKLQVEITNGSDSSCSIFQSLILPSSTGPYKSRIDHKYSGSILNEFNEQQADNKLNRECKQLNNEYIQTSHKIQQNVDKRYVESENPNKENSGFRCRHFISVTNIMKDDIGDSSCIKTQNNKDDSSKSGASHKWGLRKWYNSLRSKNINNVPSAVTTVDDLQHKDQTNNCTLCSPKMKKIDEKCSSLTLNNLVESEDFGVDLTLKDPSKYLDWPDMKPTTDKIDKTFLKQPKVKCECCKTLLNQPKVKCECSEALQKPPKVKCECGKALLQLSKENSKNKNYEAYANRKLKQNIKTATVPTNYRPSDSSLGKHNAYSKRQSSMKPKENITIECKQPEVKNYTKVKKNAESQTSNTIARKPNAQCNTSNPSLCKLHDPCNTLKKYLRNLGEKCPCPKNNKLDKKPSPLRLKNKIEPKDQPLHKQNVDYDASLTLRDPSKYLHWPDIKPKADIIQSQKVKCECCKTLLGQPKVQCECSKALLKPPKVKCECRKALLKRSKENSKHKYSESHPPVKLKQNVETDKKSRLDKQNVETDKKSRLDKQSVDCGASLILRDLSKYLEWPDMKPTTHKIDKTFLKQPKVKCECCKTLLNQPKVKCECSEALQTPPKVKCECGKALLQLSKENSKNTNYEAYPNRKLKQNMKTATGPTNYRPSDSSLGKHNAYRKEIEEIECYSCRCLENTKIECKQPEVREVKQQNAECNTSNTVVRKQTIQCHTSNPSFCIRSNYYNTSNQSGNCNTVVTNFNKQSVQCDIKNPNFRNQSVKCNTIITDFRKQSRQCSTLNPNLGYRSGKSNNIETHVQKYSRQCNTSDSNWRSQCGKRNRAVTDSKHESVQCNIPKNPKRKQSGKCNNAKKHSRQCNTSNSIWNNQNGKYNTVVTDSKKDSVLCGSSNPNLRNCNDKGSKLFSQKHTNKRHFETQLRKIKVGLDSYRKKIAQCEYYISLLKKYKKNKRNKCKQYFKTDGCSCSGPKSFHYKMSNKSNPAIGNITQAKCGTSKANPFKEHASYDLIETLYDKHDVNCSYPYLVNEKKKEACKNSCFSPFQKNNQKKKKYLNKWCRSLPSQQSTKCKSCNSPLGQTKLYCQYCSLFSHGCIQKRDKIECNKLLNGQNITKSVGCKCRFKNTRGKILRKCKSVTTLSSKHTNTPEWSRSCSLINNGTCPANRQYNVNQFTSCYFPLNKNKVATTQFNHTNIRTHIKCCGSGDNRVCKKECHKTSQCLCSDLYTKGVETRDSWCQKCGACSCAKSKNKGSNKHGHKVCKKKRHKTSQCLYSVLSTKGVETRNNCCQVCGTCSYATSKNIGTKPREHKVCKKKRDKMSQCLYAVLPGKAVETSNDSCQVCGDCLCATCKKHDHKVCKKKRDQSLTVNVVLPTTKCKNKRIKRNCTCRVLPAKRVKTGNKKNKISKFIKKMFTDMYGGTENCILCAGRFRRKPPCESAYRRGPVSYQRCLALKKYCYIFGTIIPFCCWCPFALCMYGCWKLICIFD